MIYHAEVAALLDECTRMRRCLHRIPETGFEEHKTQAFLEAALAPLHPDKLERLAGTGVKAVFFAAAPHAGTVAFRADTDGLPTQEIGHAGYRSRHAGRMHACGHDGHMTVLLLLARLVSEQRAALTQNIVLLFQPAEEGFGGARSMVDCGALENPHVDRIYGMHVWPSYDKGVIAVRWGPMMAQTSEFDIIVHGKSAHGASPQLGVDAVVAAAELITLLQTAITRNTDPHQDALLTIGRIEGGTARNVIADRVTLNCTLRVFSSAVYEALGLRVRAMLRGLQTATSAKIEMLPLMHYPCVDNPRPLVEDFYRIMGGTEGIVIADPVMSGEDFAFYQQQIPGLFFFLGVRDKGHTAPLHSPKFDFSEDVLLTGVEAFYRLAFDPAAAHRAEPFA